MVNSYHFYSLSRLQNVSSINAIATPGNVTIQTIFNVHNQLYTSLVFCDKYLLHNDLYTLSIYTVYYNTYLHYINIYTLHT